MSVEEIDQRVPIADHEQGNGIVYLRDACERSAIPLLEAIGTKCPDPNLVTAARLPGAAISAAIHSISPIAGTGAYALNSLLDWLDGFIARAKNRRTVEGAKLDPHVDKIVNTLMMLYLVLTDISNVQLTTAASVSAIVDYISQRQRGPILQQLKEGWRAVRHPETCEVVQPSDSIANIQANICGKLKLVVQTICIGGWMAAGDHEMVQHGVAAGLVSSAILGIIGTIKRWKSTS